MKLKRIWLYLSLMILVLTGCGLSQGEEETGGYKVYYVDAGKTKVVSESVVVSATNASEILEELMNYLCTQPKGEDEQYLLPENVQFLDYRFEEDLLWLNFNNEYRKMDRTQEVLIRASIVRTCIQVPGVSYVGILVENQPLKDSYGNEVGLLNGDSFVENSGNEINTYQLAHMTLYFANVTGDGLVKENRSVYYSTSMPLERAVMEELLKGPREEEHYPTLSSETKVLGVTVADGVCYVNLNQAFSNQALNQQEEIPIYSITNSLIESGSVSQVQISINGDTKLTYRENISLDQFFRKNTDFIVEDSDE